MIQKPGITDFFQIQPRLGAFEVSAVIGEKNYEKGIDTKVDILFWSKYQSTIWPNLDALTERIRECIAELEAK